LPDDLDRRVMVGGFIMAAEDRVEVHTSRLWALFNSLTQFFFPERMVANRATGIIERTTVTYWYWPFEGTEKHLPITTLILVDRDKFFFWDTVIVKSSAGGDDPLRIHNVAKRKARRFVNTVNGWIGKLGSGGQGGVQLGR
jgi:hypothetical protein